MNPPRIRNLSVNVSKGLPYLASGEGVSRGRLRDALTSLHPCCARWRDHLSQSLHAAYFAAAHNAVFSPPFVPGPQSEAGIPKDKIVAAHGNFDTARCIDTGQLVPVEEVREAIMSEQPAGWQRLREMYGGLVKPDIVFFGEQLPERFYRLAGMAQNPVEGEISDLQQADLLLILGTSLVVHPFASLVHRVRDDCARVLINMEPVGRYNPLTSLFGMGDGLRYGMESNWRDAAYIGPCDHAVGKLAELLGWKAELDRLVEEHGNGWPVTAPPPVLTVPLESQQQPVETLSKDVRLAAAKVIGRSLAQKQQSGIGGLMARLVSKLSINAGQKDQVDDPEEEIEDLEAAARVEFRDLAVAARPAGGTGVVLVAVIGQLDTADAEVTALVIGQALAAAADAGGVEVVLVTQGLSGAQQATARGWVEARLGAGPGPAAAPASRRCLQALPLAAFVDEAAARAMGLPEGFWGWSVGETVWVDCKDGVDDPQAAARQAIVRAADLVVSMDGLGSEDGLHLARRLGKAVLDLSSLVSDEKSERTECVVGNGGGVAAQYAGLWVGQSVPNSPGSGLPRPIRWSLCLSAGEQVVSAFGAGRGRPSQGEGELTLLWGHFSAADGIVLLHELPAARGAADEEAVQYAGHLSVVEGQPTLKGTWRQATEPPTSGVFGVRLEERPAWVNPTPPPPPELTKQGSNSGAGEVAAAAYRALFSTLRHLRRVAGGGEEHDVCAGLWTGECVPDPSLAADNVPVNPIKWALSLGGDGAPSAYGGGFFDDSDDIPGQPVLLFSLRGRFSPAERRLTLTKSYASPSVPDCLVVHYDAMLCHEGGRITLRGTWDNTLEATCGTFRCTLQDSST